MKEDENYETLSWRFPPGKFVFTNTKFASTFSPINVVLLRTFCLLVNVLPRNRFCAAMKVYIANESPEVLHWVWKIDAKFQIIQLYNSIWVNIVNPYWTWDYDIFTLGISKLTHNISPSKQCNLSTCQHEV